jgi:hypothetical protein
MVRTREYVSLKTKLDIALRMLGFDPEQVEWHHQSDNEQDVVPVHRAKHLALHGRQQRRTNMRPFGPPVKIGRPWVANGVSKATFYRHREVQ